MAVMLIIEVFAVWFDFETKSHITPVSFGLFSQYQDDIIFF